MNEFASSGVSTQQRGDWVITAIGLGRRVASAGFATVLINGFMFVLGLVLVRSLAPIEFGTYTMLVTLLSIAGVLISALVAQQMGYSLPRLNHPALERAGGAMYGSVAGICILFFLPITVATLLYLRVGIVLMMAGTFYVGSTMYRTYARFYFFSLRRPSAALRQDIMFVVVSALGLAALASTIGFRGGLVLVLGLLTVANLLCSVVFSDAPKPAGSRLRLRRHLAAYRRQMRRAFWSFVTVLLSTLSAVAPNLAIMSGRSLVSLAIITAPGSILAPIRLVMLTLQSTLRAEFSSMIHRGNRRGAVVLYAASTGGAILMCVAVALLAWFGWNFFYRHVFSHGYGYAEVRRATMLSVAVAAANTIRLPGGVLLNALNIFKYSAIVMAVVVPLVLTLAFWLAGRGEVVNVLYASLLGETTLGLAEAGAIFWIFSRSKQPTA